VAHEANGADLAQRLLGQGKPPGARIQNDITTDSGTPARSTLRIIGTIAQAQNGVSDPNSVVPTIAVAFRLRRPPAVSTSSRMLCKSRPSTTASMNHGSSSRARLLAWFQAALGVQANSADHEAAPGGRAVPRLGVMVQSHDHDLVAGASVAAAGSTRLAFTAEAFNPKPTSPASSVPKNPAAANPACSNSRPEATDSANARRVWHSGRSGSRRSRRSPAARPAIRPGRPGEPPARPGRGSALGGSRR
jgi:hypothetical protein